RALDVAPFGIQRRGARAPRLHRHGLALLPRVARRAHVRGASRLAGPGGWTCGTSPISQRAAERLPRGKAIVSLFRRPAAHAPGVIRRRRVVGGPCGPEAQGPGAAFLTNMRPSWLITPGGFVWRTVAACVAGVLAGVTYTLS